MIVPWPSFQDAGLPFRAMQAPRQAGASIASSTSKRADDRRSEPCTAVLWADLPRLRLRPIPGTCRPAGWPGWISSSSTWRYRRCSTASWPRRRSNSSTTCRSCDGDAGDVPGAGAVASLSRSPFAATWRNRPSRRSQAPMVTSVIWGRASRWRRLVRKRRRRSR